MYYHTIKSNLIKTKTLFTLILGLTYLGNLNAQSTIEPSPENWTAFNREVTFSDAEIYLNAQASDGVLWLYGSTYSVCQG